MRTDIHLGIINLFIFIGVCQGIFLSWFFIKNKKRTNLYQGLLLLFFSLCIFEEWLNNTGYIVQTLYLTNFSEPFSFALAPLLYLYARCMLKPEEKVLIWPHFIISAIWALLMVFQFIQPDAVKYNDYIHTKHQDWGYINEGMQTISADPTGLRSNTNQILAIQFLIYMGFVASFIIKRFKEAGQDFFRTTNEALVIVRNTAIHFLLILLIFLTTKIYFGMESDVGGYFIASYVSFMIFATSYQVLNRSDFFNEPGSFLTFPLLKYQKSSLSEENKELILTKIRLEMEGKEYYTNNLASLSGLAKQINETSHHVSQVINEKLNKNFFELLASYRVEHAKKLIGEDKDTKLTVEELAEMVGYNSKSSFNNAFKSITSKTPSEYRKSLNDR
jgi:AraC-like DNA-binding protein